MIGVMIIPTGIGCEIGGHAGDANPVVRLLAAACDTLIVHPNVVNASDINEMPENCLYVEGSILDQFLWGNIRLRPTKSNKILVAVNAPVKPETINAVSASRMTLGIDAEIIELKTPLTMKGYIEDRKATGNITGTNELIKQVTAHNFDALAIATLIDVDKEVALNYLDSGGINPWGGVEAQLSKIVARRLHKPVAHSPINSGLFDSYNKVADPRQAAEHISNTYLHSVLKGLHRAPRVVDRHAERSLSFEDVDCLISPWLSWGSPHDACNQSHIPIIEVKENHHYLPVKPKAEFIIAEDYLQAAGMLLAMRQGVSLPSLKRPVPSTKVLFNQSD